MTDSKRLFVGVRVSVATANALAGAAETLARRAKDTGVDVRWVAPMNYHVTLKFLGSTHVATISGVRDTLERATENTPRISFRTARLGGFPSLDKTRVVWAGIDDQGSISELANRISEGCARLGFAASQPFHPHVTLGRLRETRPLRDIVLPLSEQMFGDTRIDAITLFESETKSSGSVYSELTRIAFKTGQSAPLEGSERQTSGVQLGTNESPVDTSLDTSLDTDDGWPRGHVPNT